jgi:cobalt-zinc-cadmium efflux system outer membrane protein
MTRLTAVLLSPFLVAGLSAPALAQDAAAIEHADTHGPHEHVPVAVDESLGWSELLEQTVNNYPRFVELVARDDEARAWAERSSGILAGSPSLNLGYLSDALLDDLGLVEYEIGIELPLWRSGQRRAAKGLSESVGAESAAAAALLRWEVAGHLRVALWEIAAARNGLSVASEALAAAEDIQRVVQRRFDAGELAFDDTLLADATVLERRAALLDYQAELVDAERAYVSLTGLTIRPAEFAETRSNRSDFDETHPLLALRNLELERARAELEYTRKSARDNPSLRVGSRRQRDPLTSFYVDSVGVEFSMPFGGKAHVATETTAAAREVASVESELRSLLRSLDATLHEAEHTLSVTEDGLLLARERYAIASRHQELGQAAFEAGEITLVDLLRRQEIARSAALDLERLEIRHGRTIAELNQALGELP